MSDPPIVAAAGSEVGQRYHANFDVVHLTLDSLLAVVADGMGDGLGSSLAGRTAVDIFVERLSAAGAAADVGTIRDAVASAQLRVREIGAQVGELAGCTLTALVRTAQGFQLAQIGDSRAYRLRGGLLELLTVDHTMAWLGAVHGWYPFDSPQAAAARYQLTRYIGHPALPEPDIMLVTPVPGDVFLLCTDGVAEQVPYHAMLDILRHSAAPQDMVERLLRAAGEAGGRDNATAIVIRFLP